MARTANPFIVAVASTEFLSRSEIDLIKLDRPIILPAFKERAAALVDQVNSDYFHFDLTSGFEVEEPALEVIGASGQWPGLSDRFPNRKLTIVVPLQIDTSTGDSSWTLPPLQKCGDLRVGLALVYPAFLWPSVELIGDESISALVWHAVGHSFR